MNIGNQDYSYHSIKMGIHMSVVRVLICSVLHIQKYFQQFYETSADCSAEVIATAVYQFLKFLHTEMPI